MESVVSIYKVVGACLRRHCYSTIKKDRKGRVYAEVEHGSGLDVFNVYADGTVLLKVDKKLYRPVDLHKTTVSHIRYYGVSAIKRFFA
jgi:hypothetical protein